MTTFNPAKHPRNRPGASNPGEFREVIKSEQPGTLSLGPSPDEGAIDSIVDSDSMFTQKYDSKKDQVDAFRGEIQSHVERMSLDQQDWIDFLETASKFRQYSFNNQMLIHLQTGGKATQVAGFRAWQNDHERTVRKGEKGIRILAPTTRMIDVKDKNGNVVINAKTGKPQKAPAMVGVTTVAVFDVSQTEGKPLPQSGSSIASDAAVPEGFADDITAAIESEGFTVEHGPMVDLINSGTQTRGYTDFENRKVVISNTLPPAQMASTLAHELAHIKAGHGDRIDEYHTAHDGARGEMEVEAQSIAYVLCRANGMDPDIGSGTGRYIASWNASKPDVDLVQKTGERVSKIASAILDEHAFRNAT